MALNEREKAADGAGAVDHDVEDSDPSSNTNTSGIGAYNSKQTRTPTAPRGDGDVSSLSDAKKNNMSSGGGGHSSATDGLMLKVVTCGLVNAMMATPDLYGYAIIIFRCVPKADKKARRNRVEYISTRVYISRYFAHVLQESSLWKILLAELLPVSRLIGLFVSTFDRFAVCRYWHL